MELEWSFVVVPYEGKGVGICASPHCPVIGHGPALRRDVTMSKTALLAWTIPEKGHDHQQLILPAEKALGPEGVFWPQAIVSTSVPL